ncbi:MAG: hypothetical protein GY743_17000 [Planctomycetaceae bacterium]|nr:hypothetical protein [Planctomycetaceae bacterium]
MRFSYHPFRSLPGWLVLAGLIFPGFIQAGELLAYLSPGQAGYWQVWTLDPATGKSRQVSRSSYDKTTLSWYPDGKQLLLNGGQGELAVLSLADGTERVIEVAPEFAGFSDGALSPDGSQIAFSLRLTGRKSNNDIWLMASDGSSQRKLTNLSWFQGQPSWSPNGKTLYFTSGKFDQVHDIWALELETGDQRQLTQGERYHFDPAAAADGRLLFSSNRGGHYDIWLRHPDARTERLTDHEALDANPVWSAGEKKVVFESTRSGLVQLYTLDLQSHQLHQLTQALRGARFPRWSPPQEVK